MNSYSILSNIFPAHRGPARARTRFLLVSACIALVFAPAQAQNSGSVTLSSPGRNNHSRLDGTFALALLNPGRMFGMAASTAAAAQSACDLNQDSAVNVVDVQLGVNMYLACYRARRRSRVPASAIRT